jgi:hypothetical protein
MKFFKPRERPKGEGTSREYSSARVWRIRSLVSSRWAADRVVRRGAHRCFSQPRRRQLARRARRCRAPVRLRARVT